MFGTYVAIQAYRQFRKAADAMKLDMAMFAGLLWVATAWLARAQIHGFEVALVSTAIGFGLRGVRAGSRVVGGARRLFR